MFVGKKLKLILLIKYINILKKFGKYNGAPIHYIGGSDALPPPLSTDEESFLLNKLENSDFGVKTILIERNLRLVVYIARKFENTGIGVEDLISIGTIGLIKAINTFNPSKNIKLATYASRCIENEILMFIRKNAKNRLEVSLHKPLSTEGDETETELIDVLEDDSETIPEKVELNIMLKRLHKLFNTVLKSL